MEKQHKAAWHVVGAQSICRLLPFMSQIHPPGPSPASALGGFVSIENQPCKHGCRIQQNENMEHLVPCELWINSKYLFFFFQYKYVKTK